MSREMLFVKDKTRLCRVVSGPGMREEAESHGFRLVSQSELDEFRAVTRKALDAGWNPKGLGYDSFISRNPDLHG